jgi:hypothetical protein
LILLALAGCSACSGGTVSPAVVPSVNLGVCVLDQYATAPACRSTTTWVQCTAAIAAACGADVASVVQLLDAHKKAMVADGVVGRP